MIANRLNSIFFLQTVFNVIAANDIGNALLQFKDDSIRGIHLYGTTFLGVALDKTVFVGQFENDVLTEIGRIPLNKEVYADAHGDTSLLEFKLINASTALVCVPRACSICSRSDSTPDCYDIHLKFEKLSSVSATVVNNNVMIRTVYNNDDASIHYLFPTHQLKEYVFGKWSIDPFNLNEIETVAAFSTPTHSYFVGSAKRPDTPLISFNNKYNSNVKITGICNNDNTFDLASRIEIMLSCEGMPIKKSVINRATAALYLPETFKLLVAFQQSILDDGTTKNYICSYKLKDGMIGDDRFHNCDVDISTRKFKVFGFLENLKPHEGKLLFKENHSQPLIAIRRTLNEGALYALRKDNKLLKLLIGDSQTHADIKARRHLLEVVPKSNKVLFVPAHSDNTLNAFPSSCIGNCHSTSTAVPITTRCSTGTFVNDQCIVNAETTLIPTNSNSISPTFETTAIPIRKKPVKNSIIWEDELFVIASIGLLLLICVVCTCVCRCCRTRRKKKCCSAEHDYDQVPLYIQSNSNDDQMNPKDLVVLKTQPLGSGVSAIVYKGCFKVSAHNYEPVAVKIFRNEYAALMNTNELIDELKVSRSVHHSNIVAFIGHIYIDRILHIVTEFMAGGSLYDYIQNKNTVLKYQHTFDYMDQILSAMVYLTEQHIVHRDLAARNCLLNLDYTVLKVSDFGLARSVDFKGEYAILHMDTALPTRWIAIEVFSQHKFNQKSDVWSFGVLVWELFTRGNTPYFPLDHCQILKFLNSGQRLQCPETCPDQIYALMITCWDVEPRKRPTFKKLQKHLASVLRYFANSNKHLIESGYERPNSQPLLTL